MLLAELAWGRLRYQPGSELSRCLRSCSRQRASACDGGNVALARRLVIALLRCLQHGEIPAGAQLKPDAA